VNGHKKCGLRKGVSWAPASHSPEVQNARGEGLFMYQGHSSGWGGGGGDCVAQANLL